METTNDLLDGIENEVDINDDAAYKLAHLLWLEVTEMSVSKDDTLLLIIECLELIKSKDKGFVYQLVETPSNIDHSGKKLIGVIWQIAVMPMAVPVSVYGYLGLLWSSLGKETAHADIAASSLWMVSN